MEVKIQEIQDTEQLFLYSKTNKKTSAFLSTPTYKNPFRNKTHKKSTVYRGYKPKKKKVVESKIGYRSSLFCIRNPYLKKSHKHKAFEKSNQLFISKNDLFEVKKEQEFYSRSSIETMIFEIVQILDSQELEYEDQQEDIVTKTNDKTIDSIDNLIKRRIHRNVQEYFQKVSEKFQEFDFVEPISRDLILSQIKNHYLLLRKQGTNQKQIFDEMVIWLKTHTKYKA